MFSIRIISRETNDEYVTQELSLISLSGRKQVNADGTETTIQELRFMAPTEVATTSYQNILHYLMSAPIIQIRHGDTVLHVIENYRALIHVTINLGSVGAEVAMMLEV